MWDDGGDLSEAKAVAQDPPKFHIPFDYEGKPKKDPGVVRSFIFYLYIGSLLTFAAVVFFAIGYGWPYLAYHIEQLPDIELVNDYRPDLGSQLIDNGGEPIAQFFNEDKRRLRLLRYEEIPDNFVKALVATEDQQFFVHRGINPIRIAQAAIRNFRTGSMHGGSTITQQLAKDLFTDKSKTLQRKIHEALYSLKIEQALSKEEILTIYLNQVHFGHNATGLLSASEFYFGKHPTELDLAECATLVGILKANTRYSPILNPERSKTRRGVVLRAMLDVGYISEDEYIGAASEELELRSGSTKTAPQLDKYPYWTQFLRDKILLRQEGPDQLALTSDLVHLDREALETGGNRIRTTLDPQMQNWATEALQAALREQEQIRRKSQYHFGSGFSDKVETGANLLGRITGFEEPNWLTVKLVQVPGEPVVAVRHPGSRDWREEFGVLKVDYYVPLKAFDPSAVDATGEVSIPEIDLINRGLVSRQPVRFQLSNQWDDQHAEGALVCIEVGTGRILAFVGGFDWYSELPTSRRNRAVEPVQPGSSFKPIIYAAAFENGYSPNTMVSNAPYEKMLPNGVPWRPGNYEKDYLGGTFSIRRALVKSLNIPTVRVFETLVGNVYEYDAFFGKPSLEIAKRVGIRQPIQKDLSVSLGTANVTPLEMTTAYSVFANNGMLVEPYAVEWIESRDGERMYMHLPTGKENALDPLHAYLITDILTDVVRTREGTAYRLASDFPYPIAGKTGTTNDYCDAWFCGYSKNLATSVWIGHDRKASLGSKRSGSRVALPPWLDFMKKAIPYHLEKTQGIIPDSIPSATETERVEGHILSFEKPTEGLKEVEVCVYSGLRPNAYCKTRMNTYLASDVPRGFCTACGVQYKEVPVAQTEEPVYPSQSRYEEPAVPPQPRRVRRLQPITGERGLPPSAPAPQPPPSVGPQFEIENTRDIDMTQPVPSYNVDPGVQPAVPRPIPESPQRQ
jgi:penicillin-binding protein 1A